MSTPTSLSNRRSALLAAGSTLACIAAGIALSPLVSPALCNIHQVARFFGMAIFAMVGLAGLAFALAVLTARQAQRTQPATPPHDAGFAAIAESSLDAILLLEAARDHAGNIDDFSIRYLNHHAQRLIDLPADTLLHGRLCQLLPVFRTEGLFSQYREIALTGQRMITEFPIQDPHINATWLRCSIAKMGDGVVITACDLTERRRFEQGLLHASQHDALTALPNRSLLDDRIQQSIERARRNHYATAVLILDIDGFTQINEQHGRDAGDHVLKTVASRLRSAVRATDSVFRLGGDEFVILFSDLSTYEPIADFARKVVISLLPPIVWRHSALNVSASIGVATYPQGGSSPETLLVQADIAMYRMKRAHGETLAATTLTTQFDLAPFSLSIG
jgi:diguanylate cyclase (GGDEF)-like protein